MFLQHNQTELNLTEVINIKMEYLEFVMLVIIECRMPNAESPRFAVRKERTMCKLWHSSVNENWNNLVNPQCFDIKMSMNLHPN